MAESVDAYGAGLITPGLEPRMLEKASRSAAAFVHLELEDGVPASRKQEAREILTSALRSLDWSRKATFVRVNPLESGFLEDDIEQVFDGGPTGFLLAKCRTPEDIVYADRILTRLERTRGSALGEMKLAAMIETSDALANVHEIAAASPRMAALFIGPSDLGNEVGYRRTYKGRELETLFARSTVVFAAHHARLLAVDSPYVYFRDLAGTFEQACWSCRLGFDIKTCVSPKQIDEVRRAFHPSEEDVTWAKHILADSEKAGDGGRSVWATDDMMADAPFVSRARNILLQAESISGGIDQVSESQ